MTMLAIIPARGGSKRLPGKNFLKIGGKSLLAMAVECALTSKLFDKIIVTSDSQQAAKITREYAVPYNGVEFHWRPHKLLADNVQTASVVFDVLAGENYLFDEFCLLLPTTPTRNSEQLKFLYSQWWSQGTDSLMTMTPMDGHDFPPVHDGTALFCKVDAFLSMPDFHRILQTVITITGSVDINTQADFDKAVRLLT